MLHIVHRGHVGLEASLRQMWEAIYWPGMVADAKVLIGQCEAYLQCRPDEQKEPLLQHNFLLRPWSKVGMDICQFDN